MKKIRSVLLGIGLLFMASAAYAQEDAARIALVLGNGDYQHIGKLKNSRSDAGKVADALELLGFEVTVVIDAKAAEMEQAVRDFSAAASASPREAALFYYAGHGVQYEGENYLVPVDAEIQFDYELKHKTLPMNLVTAGLDTSKASLNLLLLDACRDNPFQTYRSTSRGLSPMGEGGQGNMIIVFATSPGKAALDGVGDNSPFTESLLSYFLQPGLEIKSFITEVMNEVKLKTNDRQIPWSSSSYTGVFYFQTIEEYSAKRYLEIEILQEELSKLETEIAQRAEAIRSAATARERELLEVAQQQAKAREAAKLLEKEQLEDLNKQEEKLIEARIRHETALQLMELQAAFQAEALEKEALARKSELEELVSQTDTFGGLMERLELIVVLKNTISDVTFFYGQMLASAMLRLDEITQERIALYYEEYPREPWENEDEHAGRIQPGLTEILHEHDRMRNQQSRELEHQMSAETASLQEVLAEKKRELNGARFWPGIEEVTVHLGKFDVDVKKFPITVEVMDESVSYHVLLDYTILDKENDAIRSKYQKIFNADHSGALIGKAEYAIVELLPDIWGVFPVSTEVVNLLDNEIIAASHDEKDCIRPGSPAALFSTSRLVTRLYHEDVLQDKNLLITGLPADAVVAAGDKLFEMPQNGSSFFEKIDIASANTVWVASRWMSDRITISLDDFSREARSMIWIDVSGQAVVDRGELIIPFPDSIIGVKGPYPQGEGSREAGADCRITQEGVSFMLPAARYQLGFDFDEGYSSFARGLTLDIQPHTRIQVDALPELPDQSQEISLFDYDCVYIPLSKYFGDSVFETGAFFSETALRKLQMLDIVWDEKEISLVAVDGARFANPGRLFVDTALAQDVQINYYSLASGNRDEVRATMTQDDVQVVNLEPSHRARVNPSNRRFMLSNNSRLHNISINCHFIASPDGFSLASLDGFSLNYDVLTIPVLLSEATELISATYGFVHVGAAAGYCMDDGFIGLHAGLSVIPFQHKPKAGLNYFPEFFNMSFGVEYAFAEQIFYFYTQFEFTLWYLGSFGMKVSGGNSEKVGIVYSIPFIVQL